MPLTTKDLGKLGEDLVARWLQEQGWQILQRGWHCRWGELDLVAQRGLDSTLAFVEVKTRSRGNWDADGLLAVTTQKQHKLWQAAQLFLADYAHLETLACRFDVALVQCQRLPVQRQPGRSSPTPHTPYPTPIQLGHPIQQHGYRLALQDYIVSAFEGV